jgi:hypothetical protein
MNAIKKILGFYLGTRNGLRNKKKLNYLNLLFVTKLISHFRNSLGRRYEVSNTYYITYRCCRMTSKKGGVAILVQRGIQYRELYPSNLQSLETISTHQITEE